MSVKQQEFNYKFIKENDGGVCVGVPEKGATGRIANSYGIIAISRSVGNRDLCKNISPECLCGEPKTTKI